MRRTYEHSTHASFATIGRAFNRDNFDEALHIKKHEIDEQAQIKDTAEFVKSYKLKKLAI